MYSTKSSIDAGKSFFRLLKPSKKYQICVAWLTADIRDSFEVLVLTLLEQILLGNSASPLRKALIDSNLGTALSDGTGYDSNNKDTMFVCGLKDVKKSVAGKIEGEVQLAARGRSIVQIVCPDSTSTPQANASASLSTCTTTV